MLIMQQKWNILIVDYKKRILWLLLVILKEIC